MEKITGTFSPPTQGHLSVQVKEEPQFFGQRVDWGSRGMLAKETQYLGNLCHNVEDPVQSGVRAPPAGPSSTGIA